MDTLTHALSGALLARLLVARHADAAGTHTAAPPPKLWQCVLVGTVAGAFPDIDVVAQAFGDIAYLTQHRGITHSLLMLPLWAAGLAWLLRQAFPSTRGSAAAFKTFFMLAAGGLGIHIAGDWVTQFGTMLLQPFSDQRFGLGAMFIIDLAFSGFLLAGLLLAALLPTRRWPAALGLGLASAWVGLAFAGMTEAQQIAQRQAQAQGWAVQQVVVMPRPASPFNWTVSVFDGQQYHVAHLNTRRSQPLDPAAPALFPPAFVRRYSAPYLPADQAVWDTVPQFGTPGTPAWVQEAWAHPDFAFFRWFAQTPALVEARAEGGQRCASFRDLRFEWPGRGDSPFRYGICLPAQAGAAASLFKVESGVRVPL
jgi:inner membrane protein